MISPALYFGQGYLSEDATRSTIAQAIEERLTLLSREQTFDAYNVQRVW
jgi:PIN domain nuclease of toxin-antitoxin system